MPLNDLTDAEKEIVFECLRCVASGEIIRNDGEFRTLFGIEFATLQNIVRALPEIDDSDEEVALAINNSLNNLLGYPHGGQSMWHTFISALPSEVHRVFRKWRGHGAASDDWHRR
jgi:hypothetical protein